METLELNEVGLGDAGARSVAALVRDAECRLGQLSLCNNRITAAGMAALGSAASILPCGSSADSPTAPLRASAGRLCPVAWRRGALATNRSLTRLDLGGNGCGDEGAIALAEALAAAERQLAAKQAAARVARSPSAEEEQEDEEGPGEAVMLRLGLGGNGVSSEVRQRVGMLLLELAGDAAPSAARIAVAEF